MRSKIKIIRSRDVTERVVDKKKLRHVVDFYKMLRNGKEIGHLEVEVKPGKSHLEMMVIDPRYRGMNYSRFLMKSALRDVDARRDESTLFAASKYGKSREQIEKLVKMYEEYGFVPGYDRWTARDMARESRKTRGGKRR